MKDINISIDLWGTLIKSTPTFKQEKLKLVKEYCDNTLTAIDLAFDITKKELNCIIESTGWQPSVEVIWYHLFSKLNNGRRMHYLDIMQLVDKYQSLFLKHPPEIYSDITNKFLIKLSKIGNLYISSNTMFAKGNTLHLSLPFISKLFHDTKFSDNVRVAKPSHIMFTAMTYHIGDNMRTDGWGAENAGVIPIIINSNDKTIEDAYNIIAARQGI